MLPEVVDAMLHHADFVDSLDCAHDVAKENETIR